MATRKQHKSHKLLSRIAHHHQLQLQQLTHQQLTQSTRYHHQKIRLKAIEKALITLHQSQGSSVNKDDLVASSMTQQEGIPTTKSELQLRYHKARQRLHKRRNLSVVALESKQITERR